MSILVNKKTRLVVQGLTGSEGTFHTSQMLQYGTNVVAGVTPGKGGTSYQGNERDPFSMAVPVFNTVGDAVREQAADTSIIFVPAAFAADAIMEAADAGIGLIVCITEGIPVRDMVTAYDYIHRKGVRLIGPNCPGIITPGECKIGIMPAFIHKPGRVGVISRSGTLTYESVWQLTERGIGQSTCIGIGGDPIIGTRFVDALRLYNEDDKTDGIIMIGEIGGTAEEEAAEYVRKYVKKPVVGFIAGRTAPAGRRMGHAGAIISGGKGTAAEKMEAMRDAGIHVCESPAELGDSMQQALSKKYKGKKSVPVATTITVKPTAKKKPAKAAPKKIVRAKAKAQATPAPKKTVTAKTKAQATFAPKKIVRAKAKAQATSAPKKTVTAKANAQATSAPKKTVRAKTKAQATSAPKKAMEMVVKKSAPAKNKK
jgi:succinyl-CoA synthetase alpha subunit